MKIVRWVSIAIIIIWAIPQCTMTRIEPWEIGVKRSMAAGVVKQDYDFGYQFAMPIYHRFERLPRTLQYLNFNKTSEMGALEVRTRENNIIFVDVTVVWQIKKDEAHRLVEEGLQISYPQKVRSTAIGVLREGMAELTNTDITQPAKRQATAEHILKALNKALAQYHVEARNVVIRGIRFRPEYEKKLQDKQYYLVQGKLDEAKKGQSIAIQETETEEKTIEKDIRLKSEDWNQKIEELKTEYEIQISEIEAEALKYDRKRRSEADAFYATAKAEGDLAEANAEALGQRLKSQALASRSGRTYSAIKAAEAFQLGQIELNSNDPRFLQQFGSMKAWRNFFLGN
jgi:regulator of protease activity HflC (stomatin/prohibitin superfamily)